MDALICLVEGSYWNGMTAIINSAIRNNFKGCIYLGYRGDLPKWLFQFHPANEFGHFKVSENIELRCIKILTERHLGYEKPFFMNYIIENFTIENAFYFDVDCVSIANFDFYLNWCNQHIALCMDECFDQIHVHHPWKLYWTSKLIEFKYPINCLTHPYVNSGFIGLSKKNFDILNIWSNLILRLENEGLNTKIFNKQPLNPIQGDQEILNMALITKAVNHVSIIGKEGMGFTEPSYLMVHCTKPEKPWIKFYIKSFIKNGYPISRNEKLFLDYLIKPYNNLGKIKTTLKKIDIFISKILHRVF